MSHKITPSFRSFFSTTIVLEQLIKTSVQARLNDPNVNTVNIDLDINRVLAGIPVQISFMAFSIELGLKELITIETGEAPRGHRLNKLFLELSEQAQLSIRQDVLNLLEGLTETDFDEQLSLNANAFTDWRYFHESDNNSCDKDFLGNLLCSINNYSVKLNREIKNA